MKTIRTYSPKIILYFIVFLKLFSENNDENSVRNFLK